VGAGTRRITHGLPVTGPMGRQRMESGGVVTRPAMPELAIRSYTVPTPPNQGVVNIFEVQNEVAECSDSDSVPPPRADDPHVADQRSITLPFDRHDYTTTMFEILEE